jgi:hypothetical protein
MASEVFISYSHDSPDHEKRVLALADRLRAEGIDATIDQFETAPKEGLLLWMEKQIRDAKFVLMVCTETYNRRVMKEEAVGKGLGVLWESTIIYSYLYESGVVNEKFIPVYFADSDIKFIPRPLTPTTRYDVSSDEGISLLYCRLTNQPLTPPGPLGVRRVKTPPKRTTSQLRTWSSTPQSPDELYVAGIKEVLEWEWDGRRLLEELIKLDYATTVELTPAHEGDPDQWGPVFMNHPDTWRLLITGPKNIVGYWHLVPLFPEEYELAKCGRLLDSQITVDTVRLFLPRNLYDIYFVQVCLLPKYRGFGQRKLLFETVLEVFNALSDHEVFIREICANAFTSAGVDSAERSTWTLYANIRYMVSSTRHQFPPSLRFS